MGHKNGTEAEIHARLRELTDKVRRLREELTASARPHPMQSERAAGRRREEPVKNRKPRE